MVRDVFQLAAEQELDEFNEILAKFLRNSCNLSMDLEIRAQHQGSIATEDKGPPNNCRIGGPKTVLGEESSA